MAFEPVESNQDKKNGKIPGYMEEVARDFTAFEQDVNDLDYVVKLYEVEQVGKKKRNHFLENCLNFVPEEEYIGKKYGTGEYGNSEFFIMGDNPVTGELNSKRIFIHKRWDRIREAEQATQGHQVAGSPSPIPVPSDPFDSMAKIFTMVIPLIEIATKNNGNQQYDFKKQMGDMMGIFTSGFKAMNQNLVDQQTQMLSSPETKEPEGQNGAVVLAVIEALQNFGDKFINAKGAKEKLYKAGILEDENVQAIQENQDLLSDVYTMAVHDPSIGKSKIDTIMDKLGIERPTDVPEPSD